MSDQQPAKVMPWMREAADGIFDNPSDDRQLFAQIIAAHYAPYAAAVEKVRAAAESAHAHTLELREAWRTGAITECDGGGGARSNRNVEVEVSLAAALDELKTLEEGT